MVIDVVVIVVVYRKHLILSITTYLQTLNKYGDTGTTLTCFRSYLSNRKNYIQIDEISKDFLHITCGVPQGSILGPLLFLKDVNCFHNAFKILMEVMFSDGTNLFLSHKNINTPVVNMNTELKNIAT